MIDKGFDPVVNDETEVLIIGTFPGVTSLEKGEYYSDNKNSFWKVIGKALDYDGDLSNKSYEEKKNFLLKNKIGLWDLFEECERNGSLDKNIKDAKPNRFKELFKKHPNIKGVLFNGQNTIKFALLYANDLLFYAPSTSRIATSKSMEKKIDIWKKQIELAKK